MFALSPYGVHGVELGSTSLMVMKRHELPFSYFCYFFLGRLAWFLEFLFGFLHFLIKMLDTPLD